MTPEDTENLKLTEESQKRVEYYATSVNAWFNTSLEHDKSILTLAAGGIGLLITLLTTVGLSSAEALVLYVGAISSFLVALVSVLVVFRHNRTYIEQVLAEKVTGNDPVLAKADSIALWAFGVGVVFTAVIGIATAIHSYTSKEKAMANEPTKSTQSVPLRESFNGATNLQPTLESFNGAVNLQKSFNGAPNLQPQPIASTAAPAASTPAPAPSSASQNKSGNGK
jgi:hypothetical protein